MARPRLVVVGAVHSSAAFLAALAANDADICAVVTLRPDVGASRHADYVDLAPLAAQLGVPCHSLGAADALEPILADVQPDILCVFGWSRLVSAQALAQVRLGGIGFHPSPLPVGRGRHPLIWTILLGLQESAACFFRLGGEADDGEILARRDFAVASDETAARLMEKAIAAGVAAIPDLLAHVAAHGLRGTAQDPTRATAWRKREARDGHVDFRMSMEAIDRLVRALGKPYPGADATHSVVGTGKIWRVAACPRPQAARYAEPGRIVALDSRGPVVACADGAVVLCAHDFSAQLEAGTWFR